MGMPITRRPPKPPEKRPNAKADLEALFRHLRQNVHDPVKLSRLLTEAENRFL